MSLMEKLKELKESFDNDLLTKEEFLEAKKELMASFAAAKSSSPTASGTVTAGAAAAPATPTPPKTPPPPTTLTAATAAQTTKAAPPVPPTKPQVPGSVLPPPQRPARPSLSGTAALPVATAKPTVTAGGGSGSGAGATVALEAKAARLVTEMNEVKAQLLTNPTSQTDEFRAQCREKLKRLLTELKATNDAIAAANAAPPPVADADLKKADAAAQQQQAALASANDEADEEDAAARARQLELRKQLDALKQKLNAPTVMATIKNTRAEDELKELTAKNAAMKQTVLQKQEEVGKKMSAYQNSVDVCFVLDLTGSMGSYITEAKNKINEIVDEVKKANAGITVTLSVVGYRDYTDTKRFETCNPTTDVNVIRNFLAGLTADGGGDTPEDLIGGLNLALNMKWSGNARLIVVITDAPCHGKKYHSVDDSYPDGDPALKPEALLPQIKAKRIDFYFAKIDDCTDQMITMWKPLYNGQEKDEDHKLKVLPLGSNASAFKAIVVDSIKASVTASQRNIGRFQGAL